MARDAIISMAAGGHVATYSRKAYGRRRSRSFRETRYERSADRISVYVSKTSLDGFSTDLRDNMDALYAKLLDYDRIPHESRWLISVLAMLAIERCLFPMLLELIGDISKR